MLFSTKQKKKTKTWTKGEKRLQYQKTNLERPIFYAKKYSERPWGKNEQRNYVRKFPRTKGHIFPHSKSPLSAQHEGC